MRYFFEISYKGTNYHGWQIQQNAISVQEVVQLKMKQLLQEDIEITGSGRTDAGVHAKQQIFHVDLNKEIKCENFRYQLNSILPQDILVGSIKKVIPEAHARFDAVSRAYDYIMVSQKDPFLLGEAYIYHRSIDLNKLNAASKILVGKHNFKSFSKVKTQVNNFICDVYKACFFKENEKIIFHIEANRFLRGMVRAIVGTLLLVNEDKIITTSIKDILQCQDRKKAGRSVPPEGLYLSKVTYPNNIFEY